MTSVVIGASGIVGGHIIDCLKRTGERPIAISRRHRHDDADIIWRQADLSQAAMPDLPPFSTLYCTADVGLLADALPYLATPALTRIVAFTSTSIVTKADSKLASEREIVKRWSASEQRLIATCEHLGIAWTVLRPTIIYDEGRDANISRLARLIGKFGFMPMAGRGEGLRQPVHAEDLAIAALDAAASPLAANRTYVVSGRDTITYREMIGRIFDSLGKPRRIVSLPPVLWQFGFFLAGSFVADANSAMGQRMAKDMAFDCSAAQRDFGWNPRPFRPVFKLNKKGTAT